jgi:DNA polymerase I-like protein with 3'-5' exonuclease and polymerase domains
MIETEQDLQSFLCDNALGDLIVHAIPADDEKHPCESKACVIFFKNIVTSKTYYFSFCHPDSVPSVSPAKFLEVVNALNGHIWALDKKSLDQLVTVPNVLDGNLASYLTDNTTIDFSEYDTVAHFMVRKQAVGHRQINQAIPLFKLKESFDEMADDLIAIVRNFNADKPYTYFNFLIIDTLRQIEQQGIFVDKEKFKHHYDTDCDGMVHSQYNVYTSTGRPSNRYGGINYAALNQSDGSRSCFRSRFGNDGRIVVIDYTAFHPRIICSLTKYPISVDIDIYDYLAKLYFQKKETDETDISNSKQLTFRQLYGGVEEKYSHIKYLANLKTFINEQWAFFEKNGYVETPLFKRRITTHHIQDPNPSKIFNYILQAVEGEIAIPKIRQVLEYLEKNKKKSKGILYTYDAMLYDFHRADGFETLADIREIMSGGGAFPMKTYIGETYQDVKLVSI